MTNGERVPALDGVRGIAVAIVLAGHLGHVLPEEWWISGKLVFYGRYGVDVFFVLSGFLITGILLDTCQSSDYFRRFYLRRALRIFR